MNHVDLSAIYISQQPSLTKPAEYSDAEESENHEKRSANFSGDDKGDDRESAKPDSKRQQHRAKRALSTPSSAVAKRLVGARRTWMTIRDQFFSTFHASTDAAIPAIATEKPIDPIL
jgi:hypothetical protein